MKRCRRSSCTSTVRGLRIGEVSRRLQLSARRIVEYERMGLLCPDRHPRTDDRVFSLFEMRQVARIKHLISRCGFTLASLRYIGMMVPCWKLFGCRRTACPAYRRPHVPCWKVIGAGKCCGDNCPRCIVFLTSRRRKTRPLFEKPL